MLPRQLSTRRTRRRFIQWELEVHHHVQHVLVLRQQPDQVVGVFLVGEQEVIQDVALGKALLGTAKDLLQLGVPLEGSIVGNVCEVLFSGNLLRH